MKQAAVQVIKSGERKTGNWSEVGWSGVERGDGIQHRRWDRVRERGIVGQERRIGNIGMKE